MQFVGLLFLAIPYDAQNPVIVNHWIPYHDFGKNNLERATYFWMQLEKLKWVFMYIILAFRKIDKYTEFILIFALFEFMRQIEFSLNYHDPWFNLYFLGDIGLSHLFLIFGLLIYYRLKWLSSK